MNAKNMVYLLIALLVTGAVYVGWKLTSNFRSWCWFGFSVDGNP